MDHQQRSVRPVAGFSPGQSPGSRRRAHRSPTTTSYLRRTRSISRVVEIGKAPARSVIRSIHFERAEANGDRFDGGRGGLEVEGDPTHSACQPPIPRSSSERRPPMIIPDAAPGQLGRGDRPDRIDGVLLLLMLDEPPLRTVISAISVEASRATSRATLAMVSRNAPGKPPGRRSGTGRCARAGLERRARDGQQVPPPSRPAIAVWSQVSPGPSQLDYQPRLDLFQFGHVVQCWAPPTRRRSCQMSWAGRVGGRSFHLGLVTVPADQAHHRSRHGNQADSRIPSASSAWSMADVSMVSWLVAP